MIPLATAGLILVVARIPAEGVRHQHRFSYAVMAAALGITAVNLIWVLMERRARSNEAARSVPAGDEALWQFVQSTSVSRILLTCTAHSLTSSNGFFNFRHAIGPMFAVGVVGLSRSSFRPRAEDGEPSFQRALPLVCLLAVSVVGAGLHLPERGRMMRADANRPALTATFTHPLLAGIHSQARGTGAAMTHRTAERFKTPLS